jgi:Tfp pilus assembly protein PilN
VLNKTSEQTGFLPDDYVKGRAERRSNIIAITLFVVVMGGVALAYVTTDRTWNDVRAARAAVNQRYQDAGARIEEMKAYEERVARIVDKAHIAVGLLDAVPRSNLLAEIVGRMPETLSLTRFNLETTEIKAPKEKPAAVASISTRGAAKKTEQPEAKPRPEPRRWNTTVELEGLAPTLEEVSLFIDALVSVDVFRRVRLDHTRQVEIDERGMREFRVLFELDPDADIRRIDAASVASVNVEEDR